MTGNVVDTVEPIDGFWAVIPAGGAGTRLWPLSRQGSPKFLHDLTGTGRTLLQSTWDRLVPLTSDRVVVVTGEAHADAVRSQLPDVPVANVLAEPSPRDSMPAIGLAAAMIERRDPSALIGAFHADHVIGQVDQFRDAVRQAVEVARTGKIVTLGIAPSGPSTGFGYIRQGGLLDVPGAPSARAVVEFVEKPDAATAAGYLAAGGFWWNAGMFVARASVLLDALATYDADLAAGLRSIAADPGRLAELWPGLRKIAIDHAVAEPAARDGLVAIIPARFTWDDVGDFASLGGLLPDVEGRPGVKIIGDAGQVVTLDASGIIAAGTARTIAVLGLEDVVVVDTADALLVMSRERAQDVRAVVEGLKAAGRTDLT